MLYVRYLFVSSSWFHRQKPSISSSRLIFLVPVYLELMIWSSVGLRPAA
jgi:hypothetical protein